MHNRIETVRLKTAEKARRVPEGFRWQKLHRPTYLTNFVTEQVSIARSV